MDAQTIIKNAEQTCIAAREVTPEPLRSFIMDLPQKKNLGTRDNPHYINYDTPYMTVDGRVAWAHSEAKAEGKSISVTTTFEAFGEQSWMCTAIVETPRGKATGHSPVNIGGTGVDKSNPFENAETSAVGRALGFLGYGLYGTGIVSADEVVGTRGRQNGAAPVPDMTGPPIGNVEQPPSPRQVAFIRSLADKMSWAPGETEAFVDSLKTSNQASGAINKMRERKDPRPNRPSGQESRSEAPAYGDDDIPADEDDPFPGDERIEMDENTRKAFRAHFAQVGRWKEDVNGHIQAYIAGQGWGTPEKPGTTKYLNHMQRQSVLGHVAGLPSPAWTELFGDDALKPETPWYSLVKWAAATKLEAWDFANYLMVEFGDNAPAAKRPSEFPPELVKTIEEGVKGGAELILDEIKDLSVRVKAF